MARPNTDSERVNIYIPRKVMKVARALAKKRGTTYSEVVRTATREYVIAEVKKEQADGITE